MTENSRFLLLDVAKEIERDLGDKGLDVSAGSLGIPYTVNKANQVGFIAVPGQLPFDYKEREIIVIDQKFEFNNVIERTRNLHAAPENLERWWVHHEHGYVNQRSFSLWRIQHHLQKIVKSGGVLIVFVSIPAGNTFLRGKLVRHSSFSVGYDFSEEMTLNNYSFLNNFIKNVSSITADRGVTLEISGTLEDVRLRSLLSKYIPDSHYEATFAEQEILHGGLWKPLLVNKYGVAVGASIDFDSTEGLAGSIYLLPQIANKGQFLSEFLLSYLPEIKPSLFPDFKVSSWIDDRIYELSKIQSLIAKRKSLVEEMEIKIKELDLEIQEEKTHYNFLYLLLTETGEALVSAVTEALSFLGFDNVIDIDDEIARQGVKGGNREDLQILDEPETLIVEVKGIGGYPSDDDILAVQKYVVLRMREWSKTDVSGLTIINHQRSLPPLSRDHVLPFRQEMLDAAEQQSIGLMTTWDLHRLVKGTIENSWDKEFLRYVLYQKGRVEPIPSHYRYLGTIQRHIKDTSIIGIQIEENQLSLGEVIAYELSTSFREQRCSSLQIDNQNIQTASPSETPVGILSELSEHEIKIGTRVFVISQEIEFSEEIDS